MKPNPKVLVAIIHYPPRYNENVIALKHIFGSFDVIVPESGLYGEKWENIKKKVLKEDYDSVFKVLSYARDKSTGVLGFGTIQNFTFSWQGYNNILLVNNVPFIEGYCLGVIDY